MPRVLLFRSELLPLSETFIAGQAAALQRFEPWFAGLKRVPGGLALDEARVIVASMEGEFTAGKDCAADLCPVWICAGVFATC